MMYDVRCMMYASLRVEVSSLLGKSYIVHRTSDIVLRFRLRPHRISFEHYQLSNSMMINNKHVLHGSYSAKSATKGKNNDLKDVSFPDCFDQKNKTDNKDNGVNK
jgi:hypothetical protein